MAPLPLLFLLVSTAGAFSPSAVPRTQNAAIGISATPRCTSSSLPRCRVVGGLQTSPFRNVNSIEKKFHTPTSLAVSAAAAAAERKFSYKKRIATFMAFMTGWADCVFLKKYGFFATMMTGNSFKLANALVDRRVRDVCLFVGLICSYMFGVGAFRRAELSFKNKSLHGLMAPLVAGAFIGSDYVGLIKPSCQFLPATMLAFAFGIINSIGTEVTGTLIFVVTGAMTRLSNMIVDRISRTAGRKKIPKEGALMSLSVIGGFILGAAWHTLLNKKAPELVSHGAASIIGGIYGLFFLWLDRVQIGCWWSGKDAELCLIDEEDCNY